MPIINGTAQSDADMLPPKNLHQEEEQMEPTPADSDSDSQPKNEELWHTPYLIGTVGIRSTYTRLTDAETDLWADPKYKRYRSALPTPLRKCWTIVRDVGNDA